MGEWRNPRLRCASGSARRLARTGLRLACWLDRGPDPESSAPARAPRVVSRIQSAKLGRAAKAPPQGRPGSAACGATAAPREDVASRHSPSLRFGICAPFGAHRTAARLLARPVLIPRAPLRLARRESFRGSSPRNLVAPRRHRRRAGLGPRRAKRPQQPREDVASRHSPSLRFGICAPFGAHRTAARLLARPRPDPESSAPARAPRVVSRIQSAKLGRAAKAPPRGRRGSAACGATAATERGRREPPLAFAALRDLRAVWRAPDRGSPAGSTGPDPGSSAPARAPRVVSRIQSAKLGRAAKAPPQTFPAAKATTL